MRVIGHRGARSLATENALRSLRIALDEGADGIEFDLQLSADGEVVVFHDASLRRLCGVDGTVAGRSWRELRALRMRTADLAAEPMAHLDEVIELVERTGCLANAELKMGAGPGNAEALAEAVARRLQGVAPERWVVSSFDLAPLRRLAAGSAWNLGLLVGDDPGGDFWPLVDPRRASQDPPDTRGLVPYSVHPEGRWATRENVERWHRAGWHVWPWTINHPREWEALALAGVDAIITDEPGRLRAFVERQGAGAQEPENGGRGV